MSSQHSPGTNQAAAARLGLAGPYPAGTLLGVDVSYALHSLVPWRRNSNVGHNFQSDHASAVGGNGFGAAGMPQFGAPTSTLSAREGETVSDVAAGTKAKRFKPTLNCNACVERKTRCDRGRPSCIACVRRAKPCVYNPVANVIASTGHGQRARKRRRKNVEVATTAAVSSTPALDNGEPDALRTGDNIVVRSSTAAAIPSPPLQDLVAEQPIQTPTINMPEPESDLSVRPTPSSSPGVRPQTVLSTLAGLPARHPFGGEWTHSGSFSEVISAMPSSHQCETLVRAYFDFVHPLIPVFSRQEFLAKHSRIWASSQGRQEIDDPTSLALCLAIFACGAQHSTSPRMPHALVDVCLSACHRALCLSLYLRWPSLRRCQTLLILCHCLITDCRVTEAWNFAGVTQRQAYSLGLNRQDLGPVGVTSSETMYRIRLWAAIVHQDNVLSSFLRVPRSVVTGAADILLPDPASVNGGDGEDLSHVFDMDDLLQHDEYMRAVWKLAAFAEENNLYSSHAHSLSFCATTSAKSQLVAQLQEIFDSLGPPLTPGDNNTLDGVESISRALQITEVLSVFYLQMTSICMETSEAVGMEIDVDGAVTSAHEGLAAFFSLAKLAPGEISTWNTCSTMAYLQASMLAEVVRVSIERDPQPQRRDVRLMLAKSDCDRYIDVLERAHGNEQFDAVRTERVSQLKELRSSMKTS